MLSPVPHDLWLRITLILLIWAVVSTALALVVGKWLARMGRYYPREHQLGHKYPDAAARLGQVSEDEGIITLPSASPPPDQLNAGPGDGATGTFVRPTGGG